MWNVFTQVAGNIGTSFEIMIIFVAFFGGIIFFAKGFQVGISVNFIIFASLFIWFFQANLNYAYPLIIMLLYIVILALSFFPIGQVNQQGGFI